MGKDQRTEFERVARELECDEDEARFNDALKKVATNPPKQDKKPKE